MIRYVETKESPIDKPEDAQGRKKETVKHTRTRGKKIKKVPRFEFELNKSREISFFFFFFSFTLGCEFVRKRFSQSQLELRYHDTGFNIVRILQRGSGRLVVFKRTFLVFGLRCKFPAHSLPSFSYHTNFRLSGKVSLFVSGNRRSAPRLIPTCCVVAVRSVLVLVPYLFQLCNTKQNPSSTSSPSSPSVFVFYTTYTCRSTSNPIPPPSSPSCPASPPLSHFLKVWQRFKFPCQPFVDYHRYSAARILTRYLFPPSSHSPSPHHTHSDSMLTPMDYRQAVRSVGGWTI